MTDVDKYLKENNLLLFGWNPFYHGILSDEDRKMPMQWYGDNFHFFCKHVDLLGTPLEITPMYSNPFQESDWISAFIHDLFSFMFEWKEYVWKHLNGYQGLDGITFKFDDRMDININIEKLPDNILGM